MCYSLDLSCPLNAHVLVALGQSQWRFLNVVLSGMTWAGGKIFLHGLSKPISSSLTLRCGMKSLPLSWAPNMMYRTNCTWTAISKLWAKGTFYLLKLIYCLYLLYNGEADTPCLGECVVKDTWLSKGQPKAVECCLSPGSHMVIMVLTSEQS